MAINWEKYGLVAKPGPEGGPYILEPDNWGQIYQFFEELKAHDWSVKNNRMVIAVDFKAKKLLDHKANPNSFFDF